MSYVVCDATPPRIYCLGFKVPGLRLRAYLVSIALASRIAPSAPILDACARVPPSFSFCFCRCSCCFFPFSLLSDSPQRRNRTGGVPRREFIYLLEKFLCLWMFLPLNPKP